jgi:hypothetical protein
MQAFYEKSAVFEQISVDEIKTLKQKIKKRLESRFKEIETNLLTYLFKI